MAESLIKMIPLHRRRRLAGNLGPLARQTLLTPGNHITAELRPDIAARNQPPGHPDDEMSQPMDGVENTVAESSRNQRAEDAGGGIYQETLAVEGDLGDAQSVR